MRCRRLLVTLWGRNLDFHLRGVMPSVLLVTETSNNYLVTEAYPLLEFYTHFDSDPPAQSG